MVQRIPLRPIAACLLALLCASLSAQGESGPRGHPYPRIANLYGASLPWTPLAEGLPYWRKLALIVGGGSDWHHDFASAARKADSLRAAAMAKEIRESDPGVVILPYLDVIEGAGDQTLPWGSWLRDESGERISTWPGYFRVDLEKPSVRSAIARAVRDLIFADPSWDGVFLDCWKPDGVLVPALRRLDERRVLMTNSGSLPDSPSPLVNGALSEDELNLVAEGRLDAEDLMSRYAAWMSGAAAPQVLAFSCHPRGMDQNPWHWDSLSGEERNRRLDAARDADPAMMRFGLCFTLMGEGAYAYDGGTMARGSWWWYPEYDAPLGIPLGPPQKAGKGEWRRDFEGGSVWVNASGERRPISFLKAMKDYSSGRVGKEFVLDGFDGRIFVPLSP